MKNIKRTLALLLAMVMVLTMLPLAAVAENQAETPAQTAQPVWPAEGSINLSKTATSTTNANEYLVELTIQGKNYHTSSDVVLVIDNSNSMYTETRSSYVETDSCKMHFTKLAAKAFANQLLTTGSKTQIALVVYAKGVSRFTSFYGAADKQTLLDAIDAISPESNLYNGGTNTQAGIHQAQELLNSEDSTGELKNIVLLSDGVPTYSYQLTGTATQTGCYYEDHEFIVSWKTHEEGTIDESSIVVTGCNYNRRKGDGTSDSDGEVSLTVTCSHNETETISRTQNHSVATIWEANQAKAKGTTVYSVALQAGTNGEATLKSCASDPTKGYFAIGDDETDVGGKLTSAFTAIAGSIAIAAKNGVVTDPMSDYVTLNVAGDTLVVTDDEDVFAAGNADLYLSQGTASLNGSTITWNVGNINEGSNAVMRYRVTLKDNVRKGQKVPTNGATTFAYKNYQDEDTEGNFDVPEVTVNGGAIRLHFYRVDASGNPVNENGVQVESPSVAQQLADTTYYKVNESDALDYGTYNVAAADIKNAVYYGYTFDGFTASVDGKETPVSVVLSATNATRELWFAYYEGFNIVHVKDGKAGEPETYAVEENFNITNEVSTGYLYGGTFDQPACEAEHIHDFDNENPTDFTPKAGETYYIWEVNRNYLMPKLYRAYAHPTEHNNNTYVTQLHLLTTVDRSDYDEIGFLANIDTEEPTLSTTVEVNKNGELYETLYVAENGSLGSKKAARVNEIVSGTGYVVTYSLTSEQFAEFEGTDGTPVTYEPYWITLDGVKVTNTKRTATHQDENYDTVLTDDTLDLTVAYVGGTETEALTVCAVYTLDYDAAPVAPITPVEPEQPTTVTVTVYDGETYEVTGAPGAFEVTPKGAEGKLFAGWYADEAFTEAADLTDVQEDTAIYAKYVSDNYLQVKYNNLGLLGRGSLRLVSAVDSKAYAETGFVVNGEKIVVSSYTTRYNLQNGKSLFGVGRNDPLMVASYSYRNLRRGDTITLQAYWVTQDGTEVYGDVRTLTYGRFGLEG